MNIKVYQIDLSKDEKRAAFTAYDSVMKNGGIDPSVYKCVFEGDIEADGLEDVFSKLNSDFPKGYNGRSMSVSDIVDVKNDGIYFCDTIGFKKLESFDESLTSAVQAKRMLVIEPHKEPYEMMIPDELEALQNAVGGYIECTYPFDGEDNAFIIDNEEGKLIGLEGNRHFGNDIYAGTILIAADDGEGGITDLTDDQINKYSDMFRYPEDISIEEVQDSIRYEISGFDFIG